MVDTDQAGVAFAGSQVETNRYGLAVIAGSSSYYDVSTRIDMQKLPQNIEAMTTVVQGTLTEGAIGYRKFDVVSGAKSWDTSCWLMANIPLRGSDKNKKGRDIAMITNSGQAYITGVSPDETLSVIWEGSRSAPSPYPLP